MATPTRKNRGGGSLTTQTRSHYERYPFIEGGRRRVDLWTARLRKFLPNDLVRGAHVLDVGSSVGEVARGIAERGARMTCVDLTTAASRRCRELHSTVNVVQADALALPFRDATFDHSIAIGVLHHTADCACGLAEMSRVTRPGGRMVVLLYSSGTPYHALYVMTAWLRRWHTAEVVDALPRWTAAIVRLSVRIQIKQKLSALQLKRLLADQFWTPQATFHSPREVGRWAEELNLQIVTRKRIPLYSNIFVFKTASAL